MNRIRKCDPATAEWCDRIPREKWTKAYDDGKRYGSMTTNLVESVNGMLKPIRGLPITAMVEKIFYQLSHYFNTRKTTYTAQKANGWVHTHFAGQILKDNSEKAKKHHVRCFDSERGVYEVKTAYNRSRGSGGNKHKVRLDVRTCTCEKFQQLKIPCSHVLAACQLHAIDPNTFVDECYTLEKTLQCYPYTFLPLGHDDYWDEDNESLLVPDTSRIRKKGRPRASRIRNEMDWKTPSSSDSRNHCTNCGKSGHNRKTCAHRSARE